MLITDRDKQQNIHSVRWLLLLLFFSLFFLLLLLLNAFLKNVEHSPFCYFRWFFKIYQKHESKCNLHFNSVLTHKLPFHTDTANQKKTPKLVRKSVMKPNFLHTTLALKWSHRFPLCQCAVSVRMLFVLVACVSVCLLANTSQHLS